MGMRSRALMSEGRVQRRVAAITAAVVVEYRRPSAGQILALGNISVALFERWT